jgi:hypothetical protein
MCIRQEKATLRVTRFGYCRWRDQISGKGLHVHQLTAIMAGADPHEVFDSDNLVHHKNGVKWDNRPDNLEVMDWGEHSSHHYELDRPSISERECADICRRYGEETIGELAAEYGFSNGGLSKHLSGECTHHSTDYTKGYDGPREGAWRDEELFRTLYVELETPMNELANRWGCSVATICNWKNKHGITHSNK